MSLRQVRNPWLTDVVTTTTATPAIATNAVFSIPSGAGGHVELMATGRNTANGVSVTSKSLRAFQTPGGVLALVGTISVIVPPTGDATLLAMIIDATISGNIVQPRITGIAVTSIEWLIEAAYYIN